MSPDVRRRLHALLDEALDLLEQDREKPAPRQRKRRALVLHETPITEATIASGLRLGRKAGYF